MVISASRRCSVISAEIISPLVDSHLCAWHTPPVGSPLLAVTLPLFFDNLVGDPELTVGLWFLEPSGDGDCGLVVSQFCFWLADPISVGESWPVTFETVAV